MPDLLDVQNLSKIFETGFLTKNKTLALNNVSFSIPDDKSCVLALVGESGSGKTTIANLILGFEKPTSGRILYRGNDISMMDHKEWMSYRQDVQAVFQDPYGSFNFLRKVDNVFIASLRNFHLASSKEEEQNLIIKAMKAVGLGAKEVLGKYPHQFSGGERQRIMLARIFLLQPKLIIADEPISMIDASLGANILNALLELKRNNNTSFLYITHDLSTAQYISDEIIILYLGEVMESGPFVDVFQKPLHPYSNLLIDSVPIPDPEKKWKGRIDLPKTELSEQSTRVNGCKFHPRCPKKMKRCAEELPIIVNVGGKHCVRCHLFN